MLPADKRLFDRQYALHLLCALGPYAATARGQHAEAVAGRPE